MDICKEIAELVDYAEAHNLIGKEDRAYAVNCLLSVMEADSYTAPDETEKDRPLDDVLNALCDAAAEKGIIDGESITQRDLFDTKLMGVLTPRPSEVARTFRDNYKTSPEKATDAFYALCGDVNYVRRTRIAKDVHWTVDSEFGKIDLSINLSKPEKDPRAIAAAKNMPKSGYPSCLLCRENEGYAGRMNHPARQNIRLIPLSMAGEEWFLQYSPYSYYNEHCIALSAEHRPMKIDRATFVRLLDFVTYLPHYFLGSNADLPIVGGSILSHDHMQGGRYVFPMERAEDEIALNFKGYESIKASIVRWPMSVIRLNAAPEERDALVDLADKILTSWRAYSDESVGVVAYSDGEPHNTVTPIARSRNGNLELDLVLRCNITSEEHPLGVFHPHAEKHHIKKENIGLIEVMGLAVLPARLKSELEQMAEDILAGKDLYTDEKVASHAEWFDTFKNKHEFTKENTYSILLEEAGKVFVDVLRDAGVYKCTKEGREALLRFCETLNK